MDLYPGCLAHGILRDLRARVTLAIEAVEASDTLRAIAHLRVAGELWDDALALANAAVPDYLTVLERALDAQIDRASGLWPVGR